MTWQKPALEYTLPFRKKQWNSGTHDMGFKMLCSFGKVPFWDFNAPNIPYEPYDASAGAIIISALYELSQYSGQKQFYVADKMLVTLSSTQFLAPVGENKGFPLLHSTGSKPHNSEIDVPIAYADYYFLESLLREQHIEI